MAQAEQYQPKVNEVNEFLEIASDFEDPLEVIRESLSNSYDAGATEVDITIRDRPHGSDIIIEDDGHGMSRRDLESFFDLGNSRKTDSIGYKGHGTKIFYKSDRIVVNTARDGVNLRATMDQPWSKLNDRVLPTYEVTESKTRSENSGTRIKITGFKADQGLKPESLTYNKIHHYLKWKTIAGSTAHFFEDNPHEMTITVELGDEIDDTQDKLITTNHFEFPPEQLEPGDGKFPVDTMCKHYEPRELEVNTDAGISTVQIVGMVGGKAARNQLPTYGRHSAQFGIWLAKDHIKVERFNEAISSDNEFIHFLFVANCQDIELSANREKIRNKSSAVYQAVEEEVGHYLSKITADPWFKNYLEVRRVAELERRANAQQKTVEDRYETIRTRDGFVPSNQTEIVLTLQRLRHRGSGPNLLVEDFNLDADINAIVSDAGELSSASVHLELEDHFEADKPLSSVEKIICWEYGDRDVLREYEREGYQNGTISFDFEANRIAYHNGETHEIEIVPVSSWF